MPILCSSTTLVGICYAINDMFYILFYFDYYLNLS